MPVGNGIPGNAGQLFEVAYGHVSRQWRDHVISGARFVRISETDKARERLQWRPESKFDNMVAKMVDAHVVALLDAH